MVDTKSDLLSGYQHFKPHLDTAALTFLHWSISPFFTCTCYWEKQMNSGELTLFASERLSWSPFCLEQLTETLNCRCKCANVTAESNSDVCGLVLQESLAWASRLLQIISQTLLYEQWSLAQAAVMWGSKRGRLWDISKLASETTHIALTHFLIH